MTRRLKQKGSTMFVVTGITGHTGAAAANTLLAAGKKVRAFVRDPNKAKAWADRGVEVVAADINDAAALAGFFAGAEGAYVLNPPQPQSPDPFGSVIQSTTAVRKAARDAKLPRLVCLSSVAAQLTHGTGLIRCAHILEAILADAAPSVTFVRAAGFHENWQSAFGMAKAQGIAPTFLTDLNRKSETVATVDIGRVAAEALMAEKPHHLIELSGPAAATPNDAVAAISATLGKPVQPVVPPRDQWAGILQGAGLGQAFVAGMVEMYDGWNSSRIQFEGKVPLTRGNVGLAETVKSWAMAGA